MYLRRRANLAFTLGSFIATISGCAPIRVPVPVEFDGGAGLQFDVIAGQSKSEARTANLTVAREFGSGAIQLNVDEIIVSPTDEGNKVSATLQATQVPEVTVHLGGFDDLATVCDTGESYGPFEVTLDENFQPVSISPASVTLSQISIELLNTGKFSFCLDVLSPVSGSVVIEGMTFQVGL
jgi:hypothetical protein